MNEQMRLQTDLEFQQREIMKPGTLDKSTTENMSFF